LVVEALERRRELEILAEPRPELGGKGALFLGERQIHRGRGYLGPTAPSVVAVVGSASMEDRLTPVLYLEMTEATPEEYAAGRGGEALSLPGGERATWWHNVYRDRPDLPRELPEFDTLGVYECDPTFAAPVTPNGITGHHFLRTPRPGQGRLTGKPT